jgi:PAS domain S-box-containing protein
VTTSSFPRPHALVQKKGRVLIIDDHAELVGALAAVLTTGPAAALGLDVMTASRGDRALELARSHAVDVAILDVKLPDVSGVDLIEPLRLASPHCEVVLMTGYATVDVAMGAMRSGAMAFLPKSFHPEDVLRTVEQAVARVHLKRERAELERRYRSLVDLTDVLVVALDQEDRVVLFNRKAVHLAGISADAAMGRNFIESWIAVEEKERVREALGQVRQGGQPREIEVRFVDNVHDGQGAGGRSGRSFRGASGGTFRVPATSEAPKTSSTALGSM